MQWYWAALLLFGLGVGLMMLGIPVAIAFFATNIVAAALFMGGGPGGLAVIIPPSALTVLLATLGRTDVADLLIAGIVPGFLLASMYGVLIWAWTVIQPEAAPAYAPEPVSRREKIRLFFVDVIPMVAI